MEIIKKVKQEKDVEDNNAKEMFKNFNVTRKKKARYGSSI